MSIPKINFIKAHDNNINHSSISNSNDCKEKPNELNGREIQQFYQSIISTSGPSNETIKQNLLVKQSIKKTNKSVKKQKSASNDDNIKEDSIFKYCQNGQIDKCLDWVQMGFNINIRDQYLWTPLMCSSCAGHQNIVDLLLKNGANTSAQDRKGRNAIDLALINGHQHIIESIIRHKKYSKKRIKNKANVDKNKEEVNKSQPKKCDLCEHEFTTSVERHLCSIGHQINSGSNKSSTNHFYHISQHNKGFQMMLKNGWSEDRGLGPLGTGRKYPIKTILKRDRLGIGNLMTKPKVTHFSPFDVNAVNHKSDSNSRQSRKTRLEEVKKRENKLKRIEINFRQGFK